MRPDIEDKLRTPFRALRARVLSYDPELKKYRLRPDVADYDLIECPALDMGLDCPYAPDEEVLLQRIPNQGWLVMGRIPVSRNVVARTPQQLPESPAEEVQEVSFQDPDNDEKLFHAQPGDSVIRRGTVRSILSKVGVIAHKVSDTCYRHMSKAKSVIVDRCFSYLLSVPGATINLFFDRTSEEPKLEAQFSPKDLLNAMRFAMGGGVADGEDGFELAMGQFTRFLFQLLPEGQKIVFTQNGSATQITSSISEFLLRFGTGQFRWTADGLVVTKDATTVEVLTNSLEINTPELKLTTNTLDVDASGTVTLTAAALIMQQFHWLTVVQRLNTLLLSFQTHVHDAGPIVTSQPIGNPVNEKGTPIGTPIDAGEPPLSA